MAPPYEKWTAATRESLFNSFRASLASTPAGLHIHLSGFSETRALLEHGMSGPATKDLFGCNTTACGQCQMLDDGVCRFDKRWRQDHNTSFLAYCREDEQERGGFFVMPCAPASATQQRRVPITIGYSWKSFVHSRLDDVVEAHLLARGRAASNRTILVVSAGAHHFASHVNEHLSQHQSHVKDSWAPPDHWMDRWMSGTLRVMERLTRLRASGVCALWKTNNIGERVEPGDWHHPSVEGGFHDYLNKIAAATAHEYGVPVVDVRPYTLAMTRGTTRQRAGSLAGMAAHADGTDVDYYHGYNHEYLWWLVYGEALKTCRADFGWAVSS